MTRDEQLSALKVLALDKAKIGDLSGAVCFMLDTMEKIDGERPPLWVRELGQVYVLERDLGNICRFIRGFN